MAGILISPKVDIQIRNKNAAHRKKYGSPNFRDILRQRCRERIKAKRGALFDTHRTLTSEEEVRTLLNDMMRSDVNDISSKKLETGLELMDTSQVGSQISNEDESVQLDKETNQERYIMAMYEELLEREEAMIETLLEDEVICPLCEKGVFKNQSGILSCTNCPAVLRSTETLSHLKHLINSALSTHDQFCTEQASFAIFSEEKMSGLFLLCDTCAYFIQIV